jgi:hypothetical protein
MVFFAVFSGNSGKFLVRTEKFDNFSEFVSLQLRSCAVFRELVSGIRNHRTHTHTLTGNHTKSLTTDYYWIAQVSVVLRCNIFRETATCIKKWPLELFLILTQDFMHDFDSWCARKESFFSQIFVQKSEFWRISSQFHLIGSKTTKSANLQKQPIKILTRSEKLFFYRLKQDGHWSLCLFKKQEVSLGVGMGEVFGSLGASFSRFGWTLNPSPFGATLHPTSWSKLHMFTMCRQSADQIYIDLSFATCCKLEKSHETTSDFATFSFPLLLFWLAVLAELGVRLVRCSRQLEKWPPWGRLPPHT